MRPRLTVPFSVSTANTLYLLIDFLIPEIDCPDGEKLIQLQPVRLVDGSRTSDITLTSTFIIAANATYTTTTVFGDGDPTTYTIPPQGTPPVGTVIVRLPFDSLTTINSTVTFLGAPITRTLTPDKPGDPTTVVVEEANISYTTISRTADVTAPVTRTLQPSNPGETGTVIIEVPQPYATVTRIGSVTAPVTSTQPPRGPGQTGNVFIDVPSDPIPYATVTRTGTVTAPVTSTQPPRGPGQTGTVFIDVPSGFIPYETVTRTGTVTALVTSTQLPRGPGQTGTVFIDVPTPYTTVSRIGTGTAPRNFTQPPGGPGQTGTVVVELPPTAILYTTVSRTGTVTTPVTRTQRPSGPGQTGTVFIELPPSNTRFVTTTRYGTIIVDLPRPFLTTTRLGDIATTLTRPPANPGETGTVLIITPLVFRTTTRTGTVTAPRTTTEMPSNPDETGKVIVEVPPDNTPYTTITSTGTGSTTRTVTQTPSGPGQTGTVIVEVPPNSPFITVTDIWTGSTTRTVTMPPSGPRQTSTVRIDVPVFFTTVTNTWTGSTTRTLTESPSGPGQTGTVRIDVPVFFTTVTNTGTESTARTFTQTPSGPGQTGTIVIEVPPDATPYVTTTSTGTGSVTRTMTQTPTGPGQTGTVLIEVPPNAIRFVTTTSTGTGSTTRTITQTPSGPGETGTIIIEIPPNATPYITTTITGTGSTTRTTTETPSGPGQTGTVIIDLPQPFVTTTRISDITAPLTSTILPTIPGSTGTVEVVLPPNLVTITRTGTQTAATTTTAPLGTDGTRTVIVILPRPTTAIIATTVTGPVAGTTTVPPAADCGSSCTQTVVVTSVPLPPGACATISPSCEAQGAGLVNVDLYVNPYNSQVNGYRALNAGRPPTYYQTLQPFQRRVVNTLSFPRYARPTSGGVNIGNGIIRFPSARTTYAGVTFKPNNFTLVYNGYFRAETSGSHRFCIFADDVDYFYFGSNAFDCNTRASPRANATPFIRASYYPPIPCSNVDLVAGLYYPIRSVYGQYGLPAELSVRVTPPGALLYYEPYTAGLATVSANGISQSEFLNALNNSVSGFIFILTGELQPSISCVVNGFIGQLSVQAADFSIFAIAVVTLLTVTRLTYMPNASRAMKLAICLPVWILPLITSLIPTAMSQMVPVGGNWCWISASRPDLRYSLTHGWRFLVIFSTIAIYVYIWAYLRRHLTSNGGKNRQSSYSLRTASKTGSTFSHRSNKAGFRAIQNDDVEMHANGPTGSNIDSTHSVAMGRLPHKQQSNRFDPAVKVEAAVLPRVIEDSHDHGRHRRRSGSSPFSISSKDMELSAAERAHLGASRRPASNDDERTTQSNTLQTNASEFPIRRQTHEVELEIKRMMLLNAYPFMYVLLWTPGLVNRLMEASGNTPTQTVSAALQAPTQFVGLANALTYGFNHHLRDRLKGIYLIPLVQSIREKLS
ncbi:hypothetical protein FZEAL_2077 [Fusarium zealandicum]|uniref:PA14 domain-containing protein n=1 Tax=Fusarium zealandicum TaxID=1053134 RepID=A0A8H4URK3_9HYPO|nr:hypothetical protein FZEAL_2077 [Fusarium zealandicum]